MIADILIAVAILFRPIATLFRRIDLVQAAIAIEQRTAVFDQRLVTVVSQDVDHASSDILVEQLTLEVEFLIESDASRPAIPLKPLIVSWVSATIIAMVIAMLWHSSWIELQPH